MIDRAEMVEILVREFPEIEEDIRDESWTGLVTLEASCFAQYTQSAIDSGNESEVTRCFDIARSIYLGSDDEVRNALGVSYLEHLNFDDENRSRSWALEKLPEPLLSEHSAIEKYLGDL